MDSEGARRTKVENGWNASGEIRMIMTVVRMRGRNNLLESSEFGLFGGEDVRNTLAIVQ